MKNAAIADCIYAFRVKPYIIPLKVFIFTTNHSLDQTIR